MRGLALLLTTTLILVLAGGKASAETENGQIYYKLSGLYAVNPPPSSAQPVLRADVDTIDAFDISQDGRLLVYEEGCAGLCVSDPADALWTMRRADPSGSFIPGTQRFVGIENMWVCDPNPDDPDDHCDDQRITNPRLSPDGETIYFIGRYILGPDDATYSIYSVPVRGGEAARIPVVKSDGSPRPVGYFALSHDGSKFAIPIGSIFTVTVEGGLPTRVSQDPCGSAYYPSFSPDDQTIVYTKYVWKNDSCTGYPAIQTLFTTSVDNDGTHPGTPLFPEDVIAPDTHGPKYYPTFSPDGEYVAFAHWREDGPDSLATAPATGGSITNITPCAFCQPVWLEKPLDTTITSITSRPTEAGVTTSVAFSSNRSDVHFECKLDNEDFEVCTSPKEYPGLTEGSSHTVEVKAVDSTGFADPTPARRTWTVDTNAPTVASISPKDAATGVALSTNIEVTFSEAMYGATVANFTNFTLTKQDSSGSVAMTSVGPGDDRNEFVLDPAGRLEANTTYTATIKGGESGAKDAEGNALAQDYIWSFTTGPPRVESYTPPQTTDVPRDTRPTATFSTDMRASTIVPEYLKLQVYSKAKKKWVSVAHAVSYNAASRTATIKPRSNLAASSKYQVTVIADVKSSAGVALDQDAATAGDQPKRWRFTTAGR